jgi:DNA-binding response OmpR family regulator
VTQGVDGMRLKHRAAARSLDGSGSVVLISDTPALSRLLMDVLGPLGITFVSEGHSESAADTGEVEHQLVLIDATATGVDVRQMVRQLRSRTATRGEVLEVGTILIVPASRSVRVDGMTVDVTSLEYSILERLARNAGGVVSREELMLHTCGREASPLDRSLDVHISHLRRKLREGGAQIVTVRGVGYMLAVASG